MSYFHTYRLPVMITRGNNVYGPRQYPEKLIPKCITLLERDRAVFVHGTGQARRNFLYVEDCAKAMLTVLRRGTAGEIYNIGGDVEETILAVVKKLIAMCGKGGHEEDTIHSTPASTALHHDPHPNFFFSNGRSSSPLRQTGLLTM